MIRRLLKWLFRLVVLLVGLIAAVILFRNPILRNFLEWRLGAETGLDARIGYLHLGLAEPTLRIEEVKLYDPAEFGGGVFVTVPEVYGEYDRGSAAWRRLRFSRLRLDLAELNVVEDKDGKTNLERLLAHQKQPDGGRIAGWRQRLFSFDSIDTLSLTLGRMRFSSLKNPGPPREVTLDVKDAELKHVKSGREISTFVLNQLFKRGAEFLGPRTNSTPEAPSPAGPQAAHRAGPDANGLPITRPASLPKSR